MLRLTGRAIAIVRVKSSASIALAAILALASVKMTFIGFDICHRTAPLSKNVLCDLDLLFRHEKFWILISRKYWELAQKCLLRLLQMLTFVIEWCHLESCTAWPWPSFWKSIIFKMLIAQNLRANSKCVIRRLQILIFAIDWRHCKSSIRWSWPTFQGKIYLMLYLENCDRLQKIC